MASDSWYHEEITRRDAEERVRETGKRGAFLVRTSKSHVGQHTLTLKWVDL